MISAGEFKVSQCSKLPDKAATECKQAFDTAQMVCENTYGEGNDLSKECVSTYVTGDTQPPYKVDGKVDDVYGDPMGGYLTEDMVAKMAKMKADGTWPMDEDSEEAAPAEEADEETPVDEEKKADEEKKEEELSDAEKEQYKIWRPIQGRVTLGGCGGGIEYDVTIPGQPNQEVGDFCFKADVVAPFVPVHPRFAFGLMAGYGFINLHNYELPGIAKTEEIPPMHALRLGIPLVATLGDEYNWEIGGTLLFQVLAANKVIKGADGTTDPNGEPYGISFGGAYSLGGELSATYFITDWFGIAFTGGVSGLMSGSAESEEEVNKQFNASNSLSGMLWSLGGQFVVAWPDKSKVLQNIRQPNKPDAKPEPKAAPSSSGGTSRYTPMPGGIPPLADTTYRF